MPVNSRYNRPFTAMPKMPSAIATITSSRKKTSAASCGLAHRALLNESVPLVVGGHAVAHYRYPAVRSMTNLEGCLDAAGPGLIQVNVLALVS
jgi:hypothetical protein